ncbi:prolipoprotein diacylglyceryl transferase family protein [Paenibacillus sp. MSJ-34]|uniref:prolipoprotein diacylglyceryl transferase family protein n=1 Tax=Paenibacillus sp. MSJ-34 TaxID=2841529 RepID=UPI001C105BF4|nr:prolipoprotein diacylglyceryl transferase family protein [Paenibacillus sp. MSJ-34]MBU5445334.1 prolipoprotein diacylglyceryl transferase [Paenibacillus sp. MSJ-34]
MEFPVYIHLFGLNIHPHFLFEALSYFIGFRLYLYQRKRYRTANPIPLEKGLGVLSGAIAGAAAGSKILYWFEDPLQTLQKWNDLTYLMEGKTIVGGLLGGLIGVEIAKKIVKWPHSTGDDFAIPLCIGIGIGRIGCFLTGLSDHTYGIETTWITGVDFGDGVLRHPTQIYEIAFLIALLPVLVRLRRNYPFSGLSFQCFMFMYLLFRFWIDFIKPTPHPYIMLNNVQVAALLGIIYYGLLFWRNKPSLLQKEI